MFSDTSASQSIVTIAIMDAQQTDYANVGEYRCIASTNITMISSAIILHIESELPTILPSNEVTIAIGQSTRFECRFANDDNDAIASPPLIISWTRDQRPILINLNNSRIQV
jgi:hypothetical protein